MTIEKLLNNLYENNQKVTNTETFKHEIDHATAYRDNFVASNVDYGYIDALSVDEELEQELNSLMQQHYGLSL